MFSLWVQQLRGRELLCSPSKKMFFFRRGENVGDKDWCLLEERFKNLASSGQILDSPSSSKANVSSFFLDYHMFGVLEKMMSSEAMTCAQSVSRAMVFDHRGVYRQIMNSGQWSRGSYWQDTFTNVFWINGCCPIC